MKKIRLAIIFFTLFALRVQSQNFFKFYGEGHLNNCIFTLDSNIVSVGVEGNQIIVMKTNTNGDTIWTRDYGNSTGINPYSEGFGLSETPFNEILVFGQTQLSSSLAGAYLLKLDSNGNKIWDKSFGPGSGTCIKINHRGLYYLSVVDILSSTSDVNLLETDTSGNVIWTQRIDIGGNDLFSNFDIDSNDNIYCAGRTINSGGITAGFVLKTDSSGNFVFANQYVNNQFGNEFFDIAIANDNSIYVCGDFEPNTSNGLVWVIEIDSTGLLIDSMKYGYQHSGYGIRFDSANNELVLIAVGFDSLSTNRDCFVLWIDADLNNFKIKRIGSLNYFNSSYGLTIGQNYSVVVAGYAWYPHNDEKWLCMTDSTSSLSLDIIENEEPQSGISFSYSAINNTIRWKSSFEKKDFRFDFINLSGSVIKSIFSDFNEGELDISDLERSIYLLKVSSENKLLKTYKIVKPF